MRAALNGTADTASTDRSTLIVAGATLLYLAYHLIGKRFQGRWAPLYRRAFGAAVLGLVPLVLVTLAYRLPLSSWGLTLKDAGWSMAVAGVAWLGLLPILALQARSPAFQARYPELREPFTPSVAALNAGAWVAYLIGYELFFRGILLLGLADTLGPWLALAIVTMGYVFVHLDKYAGEAVGTVFSGAAFGLAVLYSGSLLMPLLLHVLIAVSSDTLAARYLNFTSTRTRGVPSAGA